jgi:hypothetical protein
MKYRYLRPLLALVATGATVVTVACSSDTGAIKKPSGAGGTGATSTTSGTGGSLFGQTITVDDSTAAAFMLPDAGMDADACQKLTVQFIPKVPLVYVLVDQSGSMFDSMAWDPLRTSVLGVIQTLQAQVSFGFSAFSGIAGGAAGNCPIMNSVPVALNNYAMIQGLYSTLEKPTYKAETPTALEMGVAGDALVTAAAALPDAGNKYILFVTDGEPDFCDDGNAVCPVDSVVAELQKLGPMGIQTFVLGIKSVDSSISGASLQAFANAGSGVAVAAPLSGTTALAPKDIYDQCQGVPGWKSFFTTAGLSPEQALGTYAAAGTAITNAPLYNPDATDQAALAAAISSALSTVKSCSFDLQGKIKVDLPHAAEGSVIIDGTPIPYDATGTSGWTMATPTELDLVGAACDTWRTTGTNIDFDFPCDAIVIVPN